MLKIERRCVRANMYSLSACFCMALLLPTVMGQTRNCGIEHCMKCKHGHCTECEYGYHGYACDKKCQGCWHGGCEKDSGICIQCSPGYFTESCRTPCPTSCRLSDDGHRYCNRTTGHCLEGCEKAHWGLQCQLNCSVHCGGHSCEQEDGTCSEGCIDEWFGKDCIRRCPENCLDNRCSVLIGTCSEGCKSGFSGLMCNISCENCIDDECTYNDLDLSLTCTKGCKDGWTSAGCQQKCSSTCLHRKCYRNVTCQKCPDGYYGDRCNIAADSTTPFLPYTTTSGSAKLNSLLHLVLTCIGQHVVSCLLSM